MKTSRIRQAAFAALVALTLLTPAFGQTVTDFSNLNYWGSGTNHSGLVISWNDGKTNASIAWGFSWSSGTTVTVADMLLAVASADPRLFARIDSATGFGLGIYGLGYDANGNGSFSVTGAENASGNSTIPVFINGISDMNTNSSSVQAPPSSANASPSEAADHYVEGWIDNGYWEFFIGGISTSYPATWTSSMTGASSTDLANNGWYAFSITTPDYSSNLPGAATAAAVPEPSSVALLAISGLTLALTLRRRHA